MWFPFKREAPPAPSRQVRPFYQQPAFGLNAVKTSKYRLFSLLPLAIYEQFRRLSNFYFLIVAAVSFIPNVSPSTPVTTTLPLVVVVGFGLARDVYEDLMRRRDDNVINSTPVLLAKPPSDAQVEGGVSSSRSASGSDVHRRFFERHPLLSPEDHIVRPSRSLSVGDVVLVRRDEAFPADMLLLHAAGAEPLCYVSTANLDGESNLKRRLVPSSLQASKLSGVPDTEIDAPPPSDALYSFEAVLRTGEEAPMALGVENLLLRGSILRNTPFVYAVVLYNGEDTKLARNMRDPPSKLGGVERMMNRVVIGMFTLLAFISIGTSVLAGIWQGREGQGQWFMGEFAEDTGLKTGLRSLGTYLILFHTFVPISLFVTLEFVRIIQGIFIGSDMKMRSKGIAVKSKANNLNESLGYVEHIFSDKTGTLTQNEMRFVACSTGGVVYDERKSEGCVKRALRTENDAMRKLVLAMAVAHDVVPGASGSSESYDAEATAVEPEDPVDNYQGESPDEVALVQAAHRSGIELIERSLDKYVLQEGHDSKPQVYQLLAKLEFSSERKRMSTVLRCPDGRVRLISKGADAVMMGLLERNSPLAEIEHNANTFSKEGLRTLVFGSRLISESEYKEWIALFAEANTAMSGRAAKEAEVANHIERDLEFLGVTAVEDKLQDNLPGTVKFLREAGLRIWVLTGDKRETAENIGYSSRLLDESMSVVHLRDETAEELEGSLTQLLEEGFPSTSKMGFDLLHANSKESHGHPPVFPHHRRNPTSSDNIIANLTLRSTKRTEDQQAAIIIDGATLAHVVGEDMEQLFLEVAGLCKTVICARVTPLQKALVVKLVRKYEHSLTLSIGDGGNDVSMIQEAHIGVGIMGKEGTQAARAADYSMGEFQHLRRLLAVHGRYSYIRTAGLINLSFYKNIFFSSTQILFQFFCFASGTTFHNQWIVTAWNSILTLFPPFLYGIFERDLEESTVLRFPSVYSSNGNNRLFSMRTVLEYCIAYSLWHALVAFFMTYGFFGRAGVIQFGSGHDAGFYLTGLALSTLCVPIALSKFLITSHLWTFAVLLGTGLSFAALWILIPVFVNLAHEIPLEGVLAKLFSSPTFHFLWPVVFVAAFIPDFLVLAMRMQRKTNVVGQLQRWESKEASRMKRLGKNING